MKNREDRMWTEQMHLDKRERQREAITVIGEGSHRFRFLYCLELDRDWLLIGC